MYYVLSLTVGGKSAKWHKARDNHTKCNIPVRNEWMVSSEPPDVGERTCTKCFGTKFQGES